MKEFDMANEIKRASSLNLVAPRSLRSGATVVNT